VGHLDLGSHCGGPGHVAQTCMHPRRMHNATPKTPDFLQPTACSITPAEHIPWPTKDDQFYCNYCIAPKKPTNFAIVMDLCPEIHEHFSRRFSSRGGQGFSLHFQPKPVALEKPTHGNLR